MAERTNARKKSGELRSGYEGGLRTIIATEKEESMVELEEQRIGRNKETSINHTYINSGGYKRKFDNI